MVAEVPTQAVVKWLLVGAFLVAGCAALFSTRVVAHEPFLAALDVGQGDSILVDAGFPVLIDTGNPGQDALGKARALSSRVGALFITHLHADHAGDALAVARTKPAAVFWNGRTDDVLYDKIAAETQAQQVPLVALVPGDVIRVGQTRLTVLGPDQGYLTSDDPNDTSLVLRADLPGFSALLMGDAPLEAEAALQNIDVDVLKVGHHGSKNSSGEDFLRAVSPEIALISAGKGNRYGHPSVEALERLTAPGATIRRTDLEGTVIIRASDLP